MTVYCTIRTYSTCTGTMYMRMGRAGQCQKLLTFGQWRLDVIKQDVDRNADVATLFVVDGHLAFAKTAAARFSNNQIEIL